MNACMVDHYSFVDILHFMYDNTSSSKSLVVDLVKQDSTGVITGDIIFIGLQIVAVAAALNT